MRQTLGGVRPPANWRKARGVRRQSREQLPSRPADLITGPYKAKGAGPDASLVHANVSHD